MRREAWALVMWEERNTSFPSCLRFRQFGDFRFFRDRRAKSQRAIDMKGQPNQHTVAFRSKHLNADETVLGYLEGWINHLDESGIGEFQAGQLILTNQRLCLYRKALFGDHLSEIVVSQIASIDEVEQSGFRHLRVRSSTSDLRFRTTEAKELWEIVIDRLRKVQIDPSWKPPQPIVHQAALTQPGSTKSPVARTAVQGRGGVAETIDRLALQYELEELFVSPVDHSAIGLNFRNRTLVLSTKSKERTYGFAQIVSVEAMADNVTLSQTNRGSQLLGGAVGGVLFGGAGFLVGAVTGSSRAIQRVKDLKLKLTLDDQTTPSQIITFFTTGNKKGVPPTDRALALAAGAFDRVHAQLGLAMWRVQTAEEPVTPVGWDGLEKLWELKQKGALTQDEFDQQKKRMLGNSDPDIERGHRDTTTYSLFVTDWGSSGASQRVIAMLREMDPTIGFLAGHKILRTPSYRLAQKLQLGEAARIRARFFDVGVALELSEDPEVQPI